MALRILLPFPTSPASAEKFFQIEVNKKKNDLRMTMTQEMPKLALISIEHKLCEHLDYNNIIKDSV